MSEHKIGLPFRVKTPEQFEKNPQAAISELTEYIKKLQKETEAKYEAESLP